jgi:8-oxo-dGTP pyrophosphatase MutT (NUDIX family)
MHFWDAVVASVEAADAQLDLSAYCQVRDLFERCAHDRAVLDAVSRAAPEYGRPEYLLCVNRHGQPTGTEQEILTDHAMVVAQRPALDRWFRRVVLPDKGGAVLLVARWLCHLAGFRHPTVHLFIDHPIHLDHTLVQVRSVDKEEAPGCFDLPVAGHVDGLASAEQTLRKELEEEIGLTTDRLASLTLLGAYEQAHTVDRAGFRNVEYHTVYRARLTEEGWLQANASDREVAAIAVFSLADLEAMIRCFPERVASGLKGSLALYQGDAKWRGVNTSDRVGSVS